MLRHLLLSLLVLLTASLGFAQEGSDAKFLGEQAKILNKYAEDAFDDGFPQIAKTVWLMLLSEYDPEHQTARKAVGYITNGKKWVTGPKSTHPEVH